MILSTLGLALSSWLIIAPSALGYSLTSAGAFSIVMGAALLLTFLFSIFRPVRIVSWMSIALSLVILSSVLWENDLTKEAAVVNVITGMMTLSLGLLRKHKCAKSSKIFSFWSKRENPVAKVTWS